MNANYKNCKKKESKSERKTSNLRKNLIIKIL